MSQLTDKALFPRRREVASDRRDTPRHPAVEYRAWLGWWQGSDYQVLTVTLDNISRGGAQVSGVEGPAAGAHVRLCLHCNRWTGTTPGEVLETIELRPGYFRVRVRFDHPCDDEFFETAVLGLSGHPAEPVAAF